jgi:hypothetical protein
MSAENKKRGPAYSIFCALFKNIKCGNLLAAVKSSPRLSSICRLVDLQKLLQGTLLHRFAVKKRWRSGLLFSTNRKNSGHNKLAIVFKVVATLVSEA